MHLEHNSEINSENHLEKNLGIKSINRWGKRVPLVLLLIIIALGAWVRFQGVTQMGVYPYDGVSYTQEALRWASGQPPTFLQGRFYRPVSFFLQGMALRVFGVNDYAIKLMHGIMDLFSILLIYLISVQLTRSPWVGLAACLVYAFLPAVVLLARLELLHAESTFFTLWAIFFFLKLITRESETTQGNVFTYLLSALSGLFLGLAVNTHADLAFLAIGMVFYLFFSTFRSTAKGSSLKRFMILAIIFGVAFFTPYIVGFLLLGVQNAWAVFAKEVFGFDAAMSSKYASISKPTLLYNVITYTLTYYFHPRTFLIGILALGAVGIIIQRRIKKANNPTGSYLPIFLILTYILFYLLLFRFFAPHLGRLLLPLIPLFLIFLFQWYYLFLRDLRWLSVKGWHMGTVVFIGLALILFAFVPKEIQGRRIKKPDFRYVYDLLKTRVDSKNQLLVTPAALSSIDGGFNCDLYFGNNALYQNRLPLTGDYTLETLQNLLNKLSVRFVWVGKKIDSRMLKQNFNLPERFKPWLRNKKSSYSVEKDLDILHRYINGRGGVLLDKSKLGELYLLTDDQTHSSNILTNGSFEYWEKGLPLGGWHLIAGKVSMNHSLRLEPEDKTGSRLAWSLPDPLPLKQDPSIVTVRLDARAEENDILQIFFTTRIKGEPKRIHLETLRHTGNGQWQTISGLWEVTSSMKGLQLHILLRRGAGKPAQVDNLTLSLDEPRVPGEIVYTLIKK